MKTFKYVARSTRGGASQEGVAEANTAEEAVAQLRDNGLVVEKIEEVAEGGLKMDLRLGGRKTKEKDLAIFCNQMSIILEAGMPIVRTVQLVAEQTTDKTLRKILHDVSSDVAAGYPLADSFADHGDNLPATFIESVRAGEASGSLPQVFRRLSRYYEKASKTKNKAKNAMIYPIMVLSLAVVVVIVIMVFAMPTIAATFEGMDMELPVLTQWLINTSYFMRTAWWVFVAVPVAAYIAIKMAKRKSEAFRMKWSDLGLHIPVLGRINELNSCGQYASTMSLMMEAGLPISNAVDVTSRIIPNYYMGYYLATIVPDLEAGKQLAPAIVKTNAWPKLVTDMTAVGEETGEMEHTLDVLSDFYDNEVDTATERALNLLQPITLIVLAVIVAIIVFAVYVPMFTMYNGM